jgi:drug/metabolite transporter (DMT)-like permease
MGITPIPAATGMATASVLLLLPVMAIGEKPWTHPVPDGATIAAILGLALVSTVVGYILYFHILSTAGATNLLLVAFLAPVSAIMLGAIVLGERLEPKHFVGMAMIGLGLMVIDGRPARLGWRILRSSGSTVPGRHRDDI